MKKHITVLPGDGVGPEVAEQGVKVLKVVAEKFGHEFTFQEGLIGTIAIDKTGTALPDETLDLCKTSDAILFGAIGDPKYDNDPSARVRPEQGLLKLRKSLGLYANIRPVKVYSELVDVSPLKVEKVEKVDMVVVRELTGGIYFGKKERKGDSATDLSVYTKEEIERVARVAFEMAMARKKKVTSVDKANVLETSRLWRETVSQLANSYKQIALSHMFVDNAAMQIVKRPSEFDVILTENMFGDILTDEASVIAGSIGMLPSASIGSKNLNFARVGPDFFSLPAGRQAHLPNSLHSSTSGGFKVLGNHGRARLALARQAQKAGSSPQNLNLQPTTYLPAMLRKAMQAGNLQPLFGLYEPIHGSYPKAAGKNIANPIGTILSCAMMMRISFGLEKEARAIEKAVENVLKDEWRMRDIATKETDRRKILGTREMGEKIAEAI